MKRRKFIKKSLFAGLGIAATTSLYAWQIEPFLPEFTHVKMPVQNLPNHLNGKH